MPQYVVCPSVCLTIAVILRHDSENQRTVCNFSIFNVRSSRQESRAVAEKPRDAVEKFDTYK